MKKLGRPRVIDYEAVRHLIASGRRFDEIAKIMGVNVSTIYYIARARKDLP